MDLRESLTVLREGAGWAPLRREVVRAAGPDTLSFLQGQLSQDVVALPDGGSAFSLLLEPQGKVSALVRVTRLGPEEVVLDTDAGAGEAVLARLTRFKLRVRCDLEPLDWTCVAVRGRRADDLPAPPSGTWRVLAETPGVAGFDLLGPDPSPPEGAEAVDPQAYELLRIEEGVPRMGAELGGDTIPAAAGIVERSVSFTKGCYTGQELVARIDSRGGNTPTRLRRLRVVGAVPPVGAAVVVDGDEVGQLSSVAPAPGAGAAALAYVRRGVDPPVGATVRWADGEAEARLEPLPSP